MPDSTYAHYRERKSCEFDVLIFHHRCRLSTRCFTHKGGQVWGWARRTLESSHTTVTWHSIARCTNHCLRSTSVQTLSNAGLDAREIMAVRRHKSKSSLQSYWALNQNERQRWSNILAGEGTATPSHRQREQEWWEAISSETKGTWETFSRMHN